MGIQGKNKIGATRIFYFWPFFPIENFINLSL